MSSRVKKIILIVVVIYLLLFLILRFAVPKGDFIQEQITDETISAELKAISEVALKDYFDIELDEDRTWETMIVHNIPREEGTLPSVYLVMQKNPNENLEEGELTSYGVSMREDTREIISVIYTQFSNAEIKEIADEEVEKIAINFLREYDIATEEELKLIHMERSEDSELVRAVVEGDGMGYCVAYNLKTENIIYFEKVGIINNN